MSERAFHRRGTAAQTAPNSGTMVLSFVLALAVTLVRDPDEKGVAIVPSGGDKSMDHFLLYILMGGSLSRH